jgi:tripartite-type tricarboxylate transporter receptor subunit TctC
MRFFLAKYRIARGLFAPPGVPADRVTALRRAFDATMADAAFLAEANTLGFEVSPTKGEDVGGIVSEIYATPAPIVERIRTILAAAEK